VGESSANGFPEGYRESDINTRPGQTIGSMYSRLAGLECIENALPGYRRRKTWPTIYRRIVGAMGHRSLAEA